MYNDNKEIGIPKDLSQQQSPSSRILDQVYQVVLSNWLTITMLKLLLSIIYQRTSQCSFFQVSYFSSINGFANHSLFVNFC